MAKKPKLISISQIRSLSRLQVTEREAAAFFKIPLKEFQDVLKRDLGAAAAWEEGKQLGCIAIRKKQFRLADKSAHMAIFLGKQYLAQHDVVVTEHSGRDGGPIKTLDLTKLDTNERKNLRQIIGRAGRGNGGSSSGSE